MTNNNPLPGYMLQTMAPETVCNIWSTERPVCIIYVASFISPARGFYMVLSKRFSPIQADSFREMVMLLWALETQPMSLSPSLILFVSQTDYSPFSSEIFLSFPEALIMIVNLSVSPEFLLCSLPIEHVFVSLC